MTRVSKKAKLATVVTAGAAVLGVSFWAMPSAMADDQPITPEEAPEIMERPWPEYPNDGETHKNIWVVSTYLAAEEDGGEPYWPQDPTNTYSPDLAEAIERYQADHEIGEHGEIKEELWSHFSDAQFGSSQAEWGPGDGRNYYTGTDSGPGVMAIQGMLIDQGYLDEGGLDGEFGDDTTAAVEDYQEAEVCDDGDTECVDGLAGEVTWRSLVTTG